MSLLAAKTRWRGTQGLINPEVLVPNPEVSAFNPEVLTVYPRVLVLNPRVLAVYPRVCNPRQISLFVTSPQVSYSLFPTHSLYTSKKLVPIHKTFGRQFLITL